MPFNKTIILGIKTYLYFLLDCIYSLCDIASMKTTTETKKEAQNAIALQREILASSHDINNVLTTASNVAPVFHTHYANMESGKHGIATLISEILAEREAIFPAGVELTAFRKIAIAQAMFASEIIAEVQARFAAGSVRYPDSTVHCYLSTFMPKKGTIGKIKLTNAEDKPRKCDKPRVKFYLVQK